MVHGSGRESGPYTYVPHDQAVVTDRSMACLTALGSLWVMFFFFFFQAEDGIRDWSVTGVQTCALPIYIRALMIAAVPNLTAMGSNCGWTSMRCGECGTAAIIRARISSKAQATEIADRSEERRVGKEGRSRWSPYH